MNEPITYTFPNWNISIAGNLLLLEMGIPLEEKEEFFKFLRDLYMSQKNKPTYTHLEKEYNE